MRWIGVLILFFLLAVSKPLLANDSGMPAPPASPTVVKVGIFLIDIINLNESEETFEVELNVIAEWKDPRLAFDPKETGSDTKYFQGEFQLLEVYTGWWPNLLILDEIGSGDVNAVQIQIKPDGLVLLRKQVNVTLETPMKLQRYPFDTQILEADMIPFGFFNDQVILEVDQTILGASEEYAEKNQNVNIAQWTLLDVNLLPFTTDSRFYGPKKETSAVKLVVRMERKSANTVWKIIIPTIMLVLLMWAIFWMDIHDLSDRLGVSLTGILAIIAFQWLMEGNMPKISYFTFTDSLLLFSFLFMCCTIFESLIVVTLSNKNRQSTARQVDRIFQWLFPIAYFVGLGLIYALYMYID